MKKLFLFLVACFISTGAMIASTTMQNPFIGFAVAAITWILFGKYLGRKKKFNRS